MKFILGLLLVISFAVAGPLENMACESMLHAFWAKKRGDMKAYRVYVNAAIQALKDGAHPLKICFYHFEEVKGYWKHSTATPYKTAIKMAIMPVVRFVFEKMKISPQTPHIEGIGAPINHLPCDKDLVMYFLNKGLDPNYLVKDQEGYTVVDPFLFPLIDEYRVPIAGSEKEEAIVRKRCRDLIELLLIKGADPNIRGSGNNTPLHTLHKSKDPLNIYKLLIKYGAREDIKNKLGLTPKDIYYGPHP